MHIKYIYIYIYMYHNKENSGVSHLNFCKLSYVV